MGEFQIIGDKSKLQQGPGDMNREAFAGGTRQASFATKSDLNTTPQSMARDGFKGGEIQTIGTKVDLNRTPHHGWQSQNTPVSDRTKKQS